MTDPVPYRDVGVLVLDYMSFSATEVKRATIFLGFSDK